ncbi:addiction module antidote protein [Actinomyces urogenitalis]|uniref:addiction module antidote protein n=1 Tax=Actinomyces urogenitalis TaxID=103621 RepID=UPI00242A3E51|nr:addiction module antidote protein [Actinomyces urogenitalis]MCI7456325.1 putative addiction module antidote protein [Actinomyces urogenitalis]
MVELKAWDSSEFLTDEETISEYINAAMETGDPELVKVALSQAIKARGMTQVAKEAGVPRQSLYKALSQGGNPSLKTLNKIVVALGLRLATVPA